MIILSGAVLLSLPVSSKTGEYTPFLHALFTSVSAVCITGKTVVDTFAYWSFFGQMLILVLMQIGGLGFMTVATLFSLVFRRTIGHRERMVMAHTLNLENMSGIVRLTRRILLGTLAFEGAAALVLTLRFIPRYGFGGGFWRGIFVSVSAFCSAGFDLSGDAGEFISLTEYAEDTTVTLTVCTLVIIGSLGFIVWGDALSAKKFSKMSVMSQIVILFTIILILFGFTVILVFESTNSETLGALSAKGKILAAFFQSVSVRTAGFNTVNVAAMRETTKVMIMIFMFIGGASGSTAGGVKINTAAVLFFATVAVFKGQKNAVVMGRRISEDTVLRAFALVSLSSAIVLAGAVALSVAENLPFFSALFECVSAFGTAGVSLGLEPALSPFSLVILMFLMFLGKMGLMTLSMALFLRQQKSGGGIRYPEVRMIIG